MATVPKHEDIIKKMTLEEKAGLLSGKNVWESVDIPKYGIPSLFFADGPHGLRKQTGLADHLGLNPSFPATCFPVASTVANSWDESLGEEIGKALGREALSMGVHVLLGPGLNLKRDPLGGRNFEYFSEDPYLSGKMAAAYIRGIQSNGVAACPKHFAANSQESRRMCSNSVMDERTFRELYATGFEIAVKEGKARALMTSYNEVNGTYTNENLHLLQEILVEEWGFEGIVVSDWGGSNNHALGVQNGSHLEMPGTGRSGVKDITEAVREGRLSEEVLDRRIDELLRTVFLLTKSAGNAPGKEADIEAHHKLARKAAAQSAVLLKNEQGILPLKKETRIAVFGEFAGKPRYQGAGSSLVNPAKRPESVWGLIQSAGWETAGYARGYERNRGPDARLLGEAISLAKEAEVCLIFGGLDEISEAEGRDRAHLHLPAAQTELICQVSAVCPRTVVILSAGSVVEMPWANQVQGILHGYLGGQAGAAALLDILTGAVCPSGKLGETYPLQYEDVPTAGNFPARDRDSLYRESLYVGYRYYDTTGQKVRFPFGYGLSYTTFAYSDFRFTREGVRLTVTNTGSVAGAEIVQLYVGKKNSETVFRPAKELKGFCRLFLQPGQSRQAEILFDDKTFRFFDVRTASWEQERGDYEIYVGASIEDIRCSGTLFVEGTVMEGPYRRERLPAYFHGRVKEATEEEWEALLGEHRSVGREEALQGEKRPVDEEKALQGEKQPADEEKALMGINDPLYQMSRGKSLLGRLICFILKRKIENADKRGTPTVNSLFIYELPLRGIAKMAGGRVTMEMVHALAAIVNGKRWKGCVELIKGAFGK